MVNRCINLLSQQAAQKNINITSDISGHLSVHSDPDHFELIVRNLVANAIKFSHEGSEVRVNAEPSPDRKQVVFAISDHGVGINKAQQEAFRLGNIKVSFGTHREKGSGLGLMVVKDFIRANRRSIWLESEE